MKKTNAIRILDRMNITYTPIEYTYNTENLSVIKIAEDNDLEVAQVFKTLVVRGDKTGVLVCVIPGDKELSLKAIAKLSGNKKTALIGVKELQPLTGYIRGGCSPLGMKKAFPVFIDESAKEYEIIYVNAGMRGLLVGVDSEDLGKACNAAWGKICGE